MLGLGVGTLLTNQVAAILFVVGFTFIAGPLLEAGLNAIKLYSICKFLSHGAPAATAAGALTPAP